MKISFNKEELFGAINIAGRAVSSKTSMPILSCILITAFDGVIRLVGNDLDLCIETVISGGKSRIIEEGKTAVEAKVFSDIVHKISSDPESDIILSCDGVIAALKSEKTEFNIQEMDPEQFPEIPTIRNNNHIVLSQFTLREMIKDTIFSISVNDSNKMMTGEYFEVRNSNLRVVSLDGHRISIRNTGLKDDFGSFEAIIPGKALNEISRILTGEIDKEVEVFFENESVMFKFDKTTVVSRLINGEYFRIDSMLSSDYEVRVTINKKDFLENVEKSVILLRDNDRKPLIFDIRDSVMNFRLNTVVGKLSTDVDIEKTGRDLMIGFNPKFIMDVLRVIDDEQVTMYMTNAKSPCFIRDEQENYIYLILPINFNAASY